MSPLPTHSKDVSANPGHDQCWLLIVSAWYLYRPSSGYTNEVLRCHVGLKPSEESAIHVGDEVRSWSAGSCFICDDTIEHEAWNRGTTTRVVLLFDIKRDPNKNVTFPEHVYSY